MKAIKLSPFVYKVKGKNHFAFLDLDENRLFQVGIQGSLEEVKTFLLDEKLAFDTNHAIPVKFKVDISNYHTKLILREFQIRITGNCHLNCDSCGAPCCCFKGGDDMKAAVVEKVIEQLKPFEIQNVVICGGDPFRFPDLLWSLKKGIKSEKFKVLTNAPLISMPQEFAEGGFELSNSHHRNKKITSANMQLNAFSYFYLQEFNPCWGHTVAVDVDGSIKPCLWFADSVGNIMETDLKSVINDTLFEKYWTLTKDKFDTCSGCEFRYCCPDCRVSAAEKTSNLKGKTVECDYTP